MKKSSHAVTEIYENLSDIIMDLKELMERGEIIEEIGEDLIKTEKRLKSKR